MVSTYLGDESWCLPGDGGEDRHHSRHNGINDQVIVVTTNLLGEVGGTVLGRQGAVDGTQIHCVKDGVGQLL